MVDLLTGASGPGGLRAVGGPAGPDRRRRRRAHGHRLGLGPRTAGIGLALTTLLAGLATWGALVVGVPAVHTGRMSGVLWP